MLFLRLLPTSIRKVHNLCEVLEVSVDPISTGGGRKADYATRKKILTPPDFQTFLRYCHPMTEQEKAKMYFTDKDTGFELELEESMSFMELLVNNYKNLICARFQRYWRHAVVHSWLSSHAIQWVMMSFSQNKMLKNSRSPKNILEREV